MSRVARVRAFDALAAIALATVVITGTVMALAAAAPHTPVVPAAAHGPPRWISGPLGPLAPHVTAARFYLIVGVMAIAYLTVVALAVRLRMRWLGAAVVALHVLFTITAPMFSTDVFNYVIYARIGALHGLDPYVVTPAHFPHDPLYRFAGWRFTRSAYGPLFTLGSYPLATFGAAGALWALKALAGIASLACTGVIWRIARQLARDPRPAVATFALNPILLAWTVGGAHNDLLMLLGILAAVSLVLASREAMGGALLTAAVAIKASAGLAAPFLLLGARRRGRAAVAIAVVAAVVVTVALVAFSDHAAGMLLVLRHDQRMVAFDAVPREIAKLLGLRGETSAVRTVANVALAVSLVLLFVHALRQRAGGPTRRAERWLTCCGWAFVALVASSSWFLAWYTVWPLAFAAVSRNRRLLAAVLALQVYYVVNHLPLFVG